MKISFVLALAVTLFASSARISANSASVIGPLAEIDDLSVDVMWGSRLSIENELGTGLFESDPNPKRTELVKSALLATATAHLRKAGLNVVQASDNIVTFKFFGGKFDACKTKNFFMVQVDVCSANQEGCYPQRTILGVVGDAGLAQALTDAALDVLDEFIRERASYREYKNK